MQEEPGDTGSGERTERRILRVWVASFSGVLGLGFCVSLVRKSRVGRGFFIVSMIWVGCYTRAQTAR